MRGPMGAVIGGLGEHRTRTRVGDFESGTSSKERIRCCEVSGLKEGIF
ncbi:MAG: hypothetical protein QXF49_02680 [Thermosphaera sp.]